MNLLPSAENMLNEVLHYVLNDVNELVCTVCTGQGEYTG